MIDMGSASSSMYDIERLWSEQTLVLDVAQVRTIFHTHIIVEQRRHRGANHVTSDKLSRKIESAADS